LRGDLLNPQCFCSKLGAATIESAECLKDWLFSNILEDENSAGNELSDD
jgi:hypothetical protein